MELPQILEQLKHMEDMVEPNQMVILSGHIGEFITDFTLQYDELKIQYAVAWESLKYSPVEVGEKAYSDKLVEIKMLQSEIYAELMKVKRMLGELKRYRSDLNRKLDVIMNIRRRN